MRKSESEGERGIKEWKKALLWIRIRIHFGRLDQDLNPHWADPDSGGPNYPQK
jgi:hypothetical protein